MLSGGYIRGKKEAVLTKKKIYRPFLNLYPELKKTSISDNYRKRNKISATNFPKSQHCFLVL